MNRAKKIQKLKAQVAKPSIETTESQTDHNKLKVDQTLVSKAVQQIKKLQSKSESEGNDLLSIGKNPFIYLTILVNELPKKVQIKPVQIELKNSIYGPEFNSRCFFIVTNQFKQENKQVLQEFKKSWKFVSYDQFKKKFHEYKDRLALLKEYDLFFCDARIYSILKKHCGVHFYRQKKYPCPVSFEEKIEEKTEKIEEDQMKVILENLLVKSTFFMQGNGPEYTVKIGRLNEMSDKLILENCRSALKNVLSVLVERELKLSNLRRFALKGEKSESFPLFSHLTPTEKKIMQKIVEKENN